jgi:hypothetical protein
MRMLPPARPPRDGGSVSHLIRTALVASVRKGETPMNSKSIALGLGRVMENICPARRSRIASQAIRTVGLVASLVLAVAPLAGAGPPNYLVPGFFADGLTPQSRWEEILKRPGMKADFPMLGFGTTFAFITAVCVDGDSVRIADPRIDNGVRLSAEGIRAQARASMGGDAATRIDQFAAAPASPVPGQSAQPQGAPIRYAVRVHKVLPGNSNSREPIEVFLFEKPLEIPTCGSQ